MNWTLDAKRNPIAGCPRDEPLTDAGGIMENRGDPELRDRLLGMDREGRREFWREEQRRRQAAGEDHHTELLRLHGDGTAETVATVDAGGDG